jgi:hypothetical protein
MSAVVYWGVGIGISSDKPVRKNGREPQSISGRARPRRKAVKKAGTPAPSRPLPHPGTGSQRMSYAPRMARFVTSPSTLVPDLPRAQGFSSIKIGGFSRRLEIVTARLRGVAGNQRFSTLCQLGMDGTSEL